MGTRLAEIRDLFQCAVLTGEDRLDQEMSTVVASDAMSPVLAALQPRALLVTGLANIQSVRTAHVADLAAILYVRGVRPDERSIAMASQRNIVLLATTMGMFDCCGILRERGLRGVI